MLRSPWLLCHFKTLNGLAMYLYNNRNEQLVQQAECTANIDKLRSFYERVLDSFL